MKANIEKYFKAFKKLRLDRAHGVAPHKPILLISIIQSIQIGQIVGHKIFITPELVALFKSNWSNLVTTNHDPRISLPFFHMKSEGFWRLKPRSGFTDLNKMGTIVRSFSNLNAAVEYAEIDLQLFDLLRDSHSANLLLSFLLEEYFPQTKSSYSSAIQAANKLLSDAESKIMNEEPSEYRSEIRQLLDRNEDEEVFIRGGMFKREIPKIYGHRCCISGMKIDTIHNVSMIDACHIIPFSESYDDTISNGIALCPNLHRAFDRGLISINPDFMVCVSESFIEEGSYSIRQYDGQKIELPSHASYWPSRENLEWHGMNVLRE